MRKDLHTSEVIYIRKALEAEIDSLAGDPSRGQAQYYIPTIDICALIVTLENSARLLRRKLDEPMYAAAVKTGAQEAKQVVAGESAGDSFLPNGWPGQIMKDGLD